MPKSGAMTFIFGKMHLFNLKVSERMPQVKYGFECLKQQKTSWDEWVRLIYGNADHGTVEPKEMTIFITTGNH